ncbi:MAG: GNAT family N-acetyltransferase [Thermoleophilia bacterium]
MRGLGPITVDPQAQGARVGRRLMEAALERGPDAAGIRLFQDSFNVGSLALYASLGFEVKELCVVMSGTPRSGPADGVEVRALEERDLEECEDLCIRVHGLNGRTSCATPSRFPSSPFVAARAGRITAYATTLTFFHHRVPFQGSSPLGVRRPPHRSTTFSPASTQRRRRNEAPARTIPGPN